MLIQYTYTCKINYLLTQILMLSCLTFSRGAASYQNKIQTSHHGSKPLYNLTSAYLLQTNLLPYLSLFKPSNVQSLFLPHGLLTCSLCLECLLQMFPSLAHSHHSSLRFSLAFCSNVNTPSPISPTHSLFHFLLLFSS